MLKQLREKGENFVKTTGAQLAEKGAELAKQAAEAAAKELKAQAAYAQKQALASARGGKSDDDDSKSPDGRSRSKTALIKKERSKRGSILSAMVGDAGSSPLKAAGSLKSLSSSRSLSPTPGPEKVSQEDLVQPLEAGGNVVVRIISANGLAKADTFGKSDACAIAYFLDGSDESAMWDEDSESPSIAHKEVGRTKVVDDSLDPVWWNINAAAEGCEFKIPLPGRMKRPALIVKVFDVDPIGMIGGAVAAKLSQGKAKSNMAMGDFLGMAVLDGKHFLHPKDQKQIILPPPKDGVPRPQVFGKVLNLIPDATQPPKYNKLVQGTISIGIDRTLVDEQIVAKERAKEDADANRQAENDALLLLAPPGPVVVEQRALSEGGMWVPKRFGEIKRGDDRHKSPFIEGGVELMGLRHLYKLSFTGTRIIDRVHNVEEPSDSDDSENDDLTKLKKGGKGVVRLRLYMSKKKPKKRMADIEETGHLVVCETPDGFIHHLVGKHANATSFDVSLKDCPDVSEYAGCVVVKPKMEPPITDEPVVYGYCKFSNKAKELGGTEVALNMVDKDRLKVAKDPSSSKAEVLPGLNTIMHYTRQTKDAWQFLQLTEEDKINYKQFKKALDLLNIVVLEGRALRIFRDCDTDNSGVISMTEFEIALMMNDAVPKTGPDLSPLDSFYIFDVDNSGEISQTEFFEVVRALGGPKTEDDLVHIFDKYDKSNSGSMTYKDFKKVWCYDVCEPAAELEKFGVAPTVVSRDSVLNKINFGPLMRKRVEFVKFLNSNKLLKAIEKMDAEMLEAFSTVRQKVKELRIQVQIKKDEKGRAKRAEQTANSREAARDAATRNKEERAMIQREQKERAKKRIEENQMKAKLAAEQAEAKAREERLISMTRKEKEEFRIKEIRRKGEDRLILKDMGWRKIPLDVYSGADAQTKLSNLIILDLSGNKLVELPESDFLFNLNTLRSFNLSHNRLMLIPHEISNCGNLEVLLLDNNDLRQLPLELKFMKELIHFDASRNKLKLVPKEIEGCFPLKYLILHSNDLEDIGTGVGECDQLEIVNLAANKLRDLPDNFSNLTNLQKLDLSNNVVTHLPDYFGNLYKMQIVNLDTNMIQVLPESMVGMEKLEILKLNYNNLQEIPSCCKGWVSMLDLGVRSNNIRRISGEIGSMLCLQNLDCCDNEVEAIPPEFGMLTSLQALNLRTNRIKELPAEFGALISLQSLDLSRNMIDVELPQEFGLLRSLRTLDISHNLIIGLPMSFGALDCLERLDLSHNRLPAVPQSMKFLKTLHTLNVSGNLVKEFPMHLCELVALKHLDLSSNCLNHLPREVDTFTNLQFLDLHHNLLQGLPLEFTRLLDHVKEINVVQNPFQNLPEKWNYRWTEKEMYLNPSGYTNNEVFEWVRDEFQIYFKALDEWTATGAMHYENRLSFEEFIYGREETPNPTNENPNPKTKVVAIGVAKRMDKVPIYDKDGEYIIGEQSLWHPRFEEHIKRFYFTSKLDGNPPKYHQLSAAEMKDREKVHQDGLKKRADLAEKARLQDEENQLKLKSIYDDDIRQKVMRAATHKIERELRTSHVSEFSTEILLKEVERRIVIQDTTEGAIERKRVHDAREEMKRLKDHLKANAARIEAEPPNKHRTMPILTVPCWKSKAITNESLPETRPGGLSFKAKFSQKERNYDPLSGRGGREREDEKALERLNSSKRLPL